MEHKLKIRVIIAIIGNLALIIESIVAFSFFAKIQYTSVQIAGEDLQRLSKKCLLTNYEQERSCPYPCEKKTETKYEDTKYKETTICALLNSSIYYLHKSNVSVTAIDNSTCAILSLEQVNNMQGLLTFGYKGWIGFQLFFYLFLQIIFDIYKIYQQNSELEASEWTEKITLWLIFTVFKIFFIPAVYCVDAVD